MHLPHVVAAGLLRKRLDQGLPPQSLKIVTSVRDPVARQIAQFFRRSAREPEFEMRQERDAASLARHLVDRFLAVLKIPEEEETWLQQEMQAVFGLNLLACPMEPGQGYAVYRGEHPEILLIKLEAFQSRAEEALHAFFGKPVKLVSRNLGAAQSFHPVYRRFLELIRLPAAYLDGIYATRFATVFYTAAEREDLRHKWLQAGAAVPIHR